MQPKMDYKRKAESKSGASRVTQRRAARPSMSANPVNSNCFITGLMGCQAGMPAVL